jgi:hypothetical protein
MRSLRWVLKRARIRSAPATEAGRGHERLVTWARLRNRVCGQTGWDRWPRALMVFGRLRSPPIASSPTRSGSSKVALDDGVLYSSETQPQKKGRSFVYCMAKNEEPELVTPDDENGFSVRTRVHEYGRQPADMSRTSTDGAKCARTREWLVELRGFEPRCSWRCLRVPLPFGTGRSRARRWSRSRVLRSASGIARSVRPSRFCRPNSV